MIFDFRVRPLIADFNSISESQLHDNLRGEARYQLEERGLDDLLNDMRANGIVRGVVQGRDIETTFGWKISNDRVAQVQTESNHMLYGFGGIDPHKGMRAVREISRCVEDLHLHGISIDPYMAKLPASHRLFYPIYSKCVELDIPICITTGWAAKVPGVSIYDCGPRDIDRVATDFPELKVILSHGGYPFVREAIALAHRHKHLYLELSGMETRIGSEEYFVAANSILRKRVLFASAYPFIGFEPALSHYRGPLLNDGCRQDVLWNNAIDLLNLSHSS